MLLVGSQQSQQPQNANFEPIIRGLKNDIFTGTKSKIRFIHVMAKVNNFHLFGNISLRKLNIVISLLLNCKTILVFVFVFVMIGGSQIDDQGGGLDTQPTAANLAILLATHFLLWPLLNTHNVNSRGGR